MSLNVCYDTDLSRDWTGIAAIVTAADPDVLCLQELYAGDGMASHHQANRLATALGMDLRMAESRTRLHTALAWRPDITCRQWENRYVHEVHHGYALAVLSHLDWPVDLTVASTHLTPYSTDAAAVEAQLLAARMWRYGGHGILAGDLNHTPVDDPEPDWSQVPAHNRSSRTVLDEGPLRANRKMARALERAELIDVAAHLAEKRDAPELRAPTGVWGGIRVDQMHVTPDLGEAITDYARLEHYDRTDHHPIRADVDLSQADPRITEWH